MHTTYRLADARDGYRPATCEEVGCRAFREGWTLRLQDLTKDDLTTLRSANRVYKEVCLSDTDTYLVFPGNQPCLAAGTHRLRRHDRSTTHYLIGRGVRTQLVGTDQWINELNENLDSIRAIRERG